MKVISMAMANKKQRWSRLMKAAWQIKKSECLSLSVALRKTWVLATTLERQYQYCPNLLDSALIDIALRGSKIGSVKLLTDGYVSARNRKDQVQIFVNRKDAIGFALSSSKEGTLGQLPVLF